MEIEKTVSQQQSLKPVPPEVKFWNWGAFFLNWIWGIRHSVWISFLVFIPVFNLIWVFILAAKGSEWAWQKGDWKSVEEFKRTQRRWGIAGVIVFFSVCLLGLLIFFGVMSILKNSDPSTMSFGLVQQSPYVQNLIGTPIKRNYLTQGNINVESNGSGHSFLSYGISGPKGKARVLVWAVKRDGKWKIVNLIILDANNKRFQLENLTPVENKPKS